MGHGIVKTIAQQDQAFCARIGQHLFQHGQRGERVIRRHMKPTTGETCTLLQMQISYEQELFFNTV